MTGPAATPPAESAGAAGPVPQGTISTVLDWVGDDPARAQAAYDAEVAGGAPRSTLLAQLEALGAAP